MFLVEIVKLFPSFHSTSANAQVSLSMLCIIVNGLGEVYKKEQLGKMKHNKLL